MEESYLYFCTLQQVCQICGLPSKGSSTTNPNWPRCKLAKHATQLHIYLSFHSTSFTTKAQANRPIGSFYIDLPMTQIYSNKPYLEHSIQSPCVHCTCKCCTKISHKLCAVQSMNKCCTVEEMLHNNNLIICCTTNICCTKTICDKIANLLTIAKGSIKNKLASLKATLV